MLQTAHSKFKEGKLRQALQFYEQVLKKEDNLEAMLESGRILLELGDFEKARQKFEQGAKIQGEKLKAKKLEMIYPFNYFAAAAIMECEKGPNKTELEEAEKMARKSIFDCEEFDDDARLFLISEILMREEKFEPALIELRKISHGFEKKKDAQKMAEFCISKR